MSVEFDFYEVNELVADLGDAPKKVIPNVRKAVEVTARNVKDDWRSEAKSLSGKHAKGYPSSIDYTMELNTNGEIGAEIGPTPGKGQGSLGILEDAPGGVGSRPQKAGTKAAKKAEKDFEAGLLKAVGDVLD